MDKLNIPVYLIDRYIRYGTDSTFYTYEEWCSIYPLTKMSLNEIFKYKERELGTNAS
jgi:hypothetical protein